MILLLGGLIATLGFVQPSHRGPSGVAIRRMGLNAASAQPPNARFGLPGQDDMHAAQARQQALEEKRRAAREAVILRQRLMQRQMLQQRGFAGQRVVVQQQWTDGQLEPSVFKQYGTASGARRQLGWKLTQEIIEVDRTCKLTDSQKNKLQLAGHGDIKRFFDRYEEVKRKAQASVQDQQAIQEIWQDISALQITLQAGLFHDDSLLVKSLPNALTGDQFARYDAMARERRAARHRECVERAVATFTRAFENAVARLDRNIALREEQREALITLMNQETRPSPKAGPYDTQVLLVQLGRLPQEKLKRLFDEGQLDIVNQQLAGYQQLEPMLKQAGLMPALDDGADGSAERPAPGKN